MILYGLYSKKQDCLMSFDASSNSDGGFCVDVAFSLNSYNKSDTFLWTTTNIKTAEEVVKSSAAWYNASYETPEWNEDYYGELEVAILNDW